MIHAVRTYHDGDPALLPTMSYRHFDEIDRAVLLARRAAAAGHLAGTRSLTRFLYHRWFLGRSTGPGDPTTRLHRQPATPVRPPAPWRTGGPRWDEPGAPRGDRLVRLYLSCAPSTGLHAVAAVTARARHWDHPWLLTTRALAQPVPTPDSTVLYLPVAALHDLRTPLASLLDELQPFLGSTVPALTLRIGRGAALAQNPSDGRRFGEHRCALIADTVSANLHEHHREVVERTLAAFRAAGVDPQRPYRSLGATWDWQQQRVAA